MIFVFLWATGFIGARMGMPHAEPGSFLALRFAIAAALLAIIAIWYRATWPRGAMFGHTLLVGVLIHGIYLGAVFWAIDRGMPAGVSALIVGLQPLLTALLAGAFLNEKITRIHWASLAIGLAGVALVVIPKLEGHGSGITPPTVIACFIAVLGITLGTVYQKRFATGVDLRSGTSVQYIGGLIPTLAFAIAYERFDFNWTGELVFAYVWLIFVLSLFAVMLLMQLIKQGSISTVSSLFYLVPAVAAVIAYFLFDERLTAIQLVGMGLCAIAVFIAMGQGKSSPSSLPDTDTRANR